MGPNIEIMRIRRRLLVRVVEDFDAALMRAMEFLCIAILLFVGYVLVDSSIVEHSVDRAVAEIRESRATNIGNYEGMVGWIKIEGTHIDYPLMQGKNNEWYLRHDFENNYATAGSIFLDYRNKMDDDYLIVYGHRMTGGAMFSDVGNYAEMEYLKKNRVGQLWLGDEEHKMEILAYAEIAANDMRFYGLGNYSNREIMREFSLEAFNVELSEDAERLVLLSTCDAMRNDKRDVLLVKLD